MSDSAQAVNELTVLSCAIEGSKMVVPDVLIAEIVDFQSTATDTDDVPTWYLGKLPWRMLEVPLISIEALNSNSFFSQSDSLKIIVLHGSNYRKGMPYWAFVSLETPRMMRVKPNDMYKIDDVELGNIEAMQSTLDQDVVMVPDIQKIEAEMAGYLGFSE